MEKLKVLLPLFLILLLFTAGCAAASDPESPPASAVPNEDAAVEGEEGEAKDAPAIQAPEGPLDAIGAIEAALAHTPGAVVEIDAERNRWEVTVLREDGTGVELYIDAATGEVQRERDKRLWSAQRTAPAVTADAAIGAALTEVPGSVIELDLDTEGRTVVWEVLVRADSGARMEVYIDAASGEVVKAERDD